MGLDMYLHAEKYVSGWSHRVDPAFAKLVEAIGVSPAKESPSLTVSVTVGYWRKANAIHGWFVEHVQDGDDSGREVPVGREQLAELREACRAVLDASRPTLGTVDNGTTYHGDGRVERHLEPGVVVANPETAAAVLPTRSGFFFGSTNYDEYYLDDLKDTVKIIDHVLSDPALEGWEFTYRASW